MKQRKFIQAASYSITGGMRGLSLTFTVIALLNCLSLGNALHAMPLEKNSGPQEQKQGIVNPNIIVNNNPDLTSLDALVRSIIKPGMTDKEKTFAVYDFMVELGYEAVYPTDCTDAYWHTCQYHPIKFLNVFSWGECGTYQGLLCELLTATGVPARQIEIKGHWVAEAFYDDAWHYLDPRWKTFFFKRDGVTVASCQDLVDDTTLVLNPVNRDVLGYSPPDEWLRHWASHFVYAKIIKDKHTDENGIYQHTGEHHTMDITLARGDEYTLSTGKEGEKGYWYYPVDLTEKYLKAAINRNHHTLELPGTGPRPIGDSKVSGHWKFPGFSNSKLIYTADFKSGSYIDRVVEENNIVISKKIPFLHPDKTGEGAYIVFEINSPYIMVHNLLKIDIIKQHENDKFKISISTDDGITWKELSGTGTEVDFSQYVYGKYKYRVKFDLYAGTKNTGIGINTLKLINIFQSSPLTVQALRKGVNNIRVYVDNSETLKKCRLYTEYGWKEKDSKTGNEIEKTEEWKITDSPIEYKIICGDESEPVTQNVKFMVR